MIWQNLINDEQADLSGLARNRSFRVFVEDEIGALIEDIKEEPLTLSTLMQAQFLVATELARRSTQNQAGFTKIAQGLSQFAIAEHFLASLPKPETPQEYFQKIPGLTDDELEEVREGRWTVGDLLERRPAVILGPLLRASMFLN